MKNSDSNLRFAGIAVCVAIFGGGLLWMTGHVERMLRGEFGGGTLLWFFGYLVLVAAAFFVPAFLMAMDTMKEITEAAYHRFWEILYEALFAEFGDLDGEIFATLANGPLYKQFRNIWKKCSLDDGDAKLLREFFEQLAEEFRQAFSLPEKDFRKKFSDALRIAFRDWQGFNNISEPAQKALEQFERG